MYGIISILKTRWPKRGRHTFLKRQFYILNTFIFFCTPVLFAQSEIDSLKSALDISRGLHRAEILLELAEHIHQKNVEKAIIQVEEALQIAQRHAADELQTASHQKLGWYYSMLNKDTTALEHYLSALRMERRHGHRLEEADVLHALGRFYMEQGSYVQALNYFLQTLRIRQDEGQKNATANTLKYIGALYSRQNKFQLSTDFYKQAYERSKELKNYSQMAMAASGAAFALQELDKYDEAILNFEQALKAANKINSIHKVHAKTGILIAMSSVYRDKKLYDQALGLLYKQLKIAGKHESKVLQARGYINLAELFEEKDNLEQANQYLKKAILLKNELGISVNISLNKLAQNYLAQGRYSNAISTANDALVEAEKSGTLQDKKAILETLAKVYIQQGMYQKAFEVQDRLMTIKEKIFNEVKAQQMAEMQVRYETEQKEQQIALLQKKQENATLWRKALIIGLILIVVIGFLIYKRQRLKIKKNKTDLENVRLKEQQLKQDVEFKNKQLATHSLNLVQKNKIMKELKQNITDIQNNSNGKSHRKLRDLQYMVDYSFNLDKDWEDFKYYFEEVHTGFFKALKARSPDLTTNELRLSALVKLNLTIKEVAAIMNISPNSVKTARYRLRKKLGMKTEENLTDFMLNIEKETAEK